MTQAEKDVLTAIVDQLEQTTQAVIALQAKTNIHSLVRLPQKLGSLRTKISGLQSS